MILGVCVNPAIDLTVGVENFRRGALNRVVFKRTACGGKGVNFVAAARKLGIECAATGFLGNDGGAAFRAYFDSAGIKHNFISCEGRVRGNLKILSLSAPSGADGRYRAETLTEINEAGFPAPPALQASLIDAVGNAHADMTVFCGGLPPETREDFYYRLARACGKTPFALDCEKRAMLPALAAGPVLIKPNKAELEEIVCNTLSGFSDIVNAAKTLLSKGARVCLVSLGADGALITDGRAAYHAQYTLPVTPVNLCGCGDAMTAAACGAILKGCNLLEIVSRAVAAGTLAVTCPSIADMDAGRADEILKNVKAEEIL